MDRFLRKLKTEVEFYRKEARALDEAGDDLPAARLMGIGMGLNIAAVLYKETKKVR